MTSQTSVGIPVMALIVAVALAPSLSAHHSFAAEYDSNKPLNVTGAVTKIEWNNPHVYFYIDVRDEKTGKVTNWAFEMGAPAVIQRSGWTRTTMTIGDLVTVTGSQAKSGRPHGNARTVTMTRTGKRLGAGSSEGQAPSQQ
jgi:DNA/RNA endonuclease YhcR with UshA esterase domain